MNKKLYLNKGDKYSRLTIIKEVKQKGYKRYFKCKCDCGNTTISQLNNLRNGHTKSCGCICKEGNNKKHGFAGTRIHRIWVGIKSRCNNKNSTKYENRGGRGITYDPKWEKFEYFYKDMKDGYNDKLTIEREDNNGNYTKSNCYWATITEQARNKRSNIMYKDKCLKEWCKDLGLKYTTIFSRIKYFGRSIEEALELKYKKRWEKIIKN